MKKALVAGALGVTGRTLVNHLVSLGDWEVIGLSRRSPEFQTGAKHISVDLSNRSTIESRLSGIGDVTHIFYAALYWGKNVFDEVRPNMAMLTNLVETVERTSNQFRKVVLLEGAKYYGAQLAERQWRRFALFPVLIPSPAVREDELAERQWRSHDADLVVLVSAI